MSWSRKLVPWILGLILAVLLVIIFCPAFTRAKVKGGPGPRATIRIHLDMIGDAKRSLQESQHFPDSYWPSRAEIVSAYTRKSGYVFDTVFKPSNWGEVYIVNRIGAPALAYLSNAVGGFPEGRLLTAGDLGFGAQQDGSANGRQPARSETNRTSSAAASRR